jgi:hypothetical protein
MADDPGSAADTATVPTWFWAAAVAALLFELVGCYFYLVEVGMTAEDIAALPLDDRALLEARPAWYYAAFAGAVWVGLTGAVGLLLRRRWAVPALLISLLAAIVQFSSIFIVPAMGAISSDALAGPIGIIVVCYVIFMLARLAARRGWLR